MSGSRNRKALNSVGYELSMTPSQVCLCDTLTLYCLSIANTNHVEDTGVSVFTEEPAVSESNQTCLQTE
jgi:hypothetical protein